MVRIISGGENLGGPADLIHRIGGHPRFGGIGHRGREIGGEILRASEYLVDATPTADGVEPRSPDPVNGTRIKHSLVEPIGILDERVTEELSSEVLDVDFHLNAYLSLRSLENLHRRGVAASAQDTS